MKDQKMRVRSEKCCLPGTPRPVQSRQVWLSAVALHKAQSQIREGIKCVVSWIQEKCKIKEVGSRVFLMLHPMVATRGSERPDRPDLGWGCSSMVKCLPRMH